jgi:endonuclease/exonuclease/phosphatase family metal-dependent hydrolase
MSEPAYETANTGAYPRIPLATYNIHQCVGTDGLRDPKRVLRVLRELRADVIGLQEVHSEQGRTPDLAQLDYLAHGVGLTPLAGPTMLRGSGQYGNALLSRLPVLEHRLLDISVQGREPRGAIDTVLRVNRHRLRVVVTHLGLRPAERRLQVERLLKVLRPSADPPLVVLADTNEWFPLSRSLRAFWKYFRKVPAHGTFPSWFPVLSLDRIGVTQGVGLERIRVHRTPLSRKASDHLPVKAWLRLATSS